MDNTDISIAFKRTLKGQNFMTPDVIEYGHSGKFIYEISEGSSPFSGERMFGVTVLKILKDGTFEHRHDLGQAQDDLDSARGYAQSLINLK